MNLALNGNLGHHTRQRKESPLGLLIALIAANPKASEATHRAKFLAMLREEEYMDFAEAALDEWIRIKYSTALAAASPPSVSDIVRRATERKKKAEAENHATEKAKGLIGQRLLDYVMPNRKPLRDCTGGECMKFGGLFSRIGERVGKNRMVGDVLTSNEIAGLWK